MQDTRSVLTRIILKDGHIRAEIAQRQTAFETLEFLQAVAAAAIAHNCARILIYVKDSNPLFKVEKYGISVYFKALAANPAYKVALLSDSEEIRASHEYIVVLASQYGARVQSFKSERVAVAWLARE